MSQSQQDSQLRTPATPATPATPQAHTPAPARTPATGGGRNEVQPTPRPRTPAPLRRELGISPVRLAAPAGRRGSGGGGSSLGDGSPGGGGGGGGGGGSPDGSPGSPEKASEQQRVIWGTNINYEDAVAAFKTFLTEFACAGKDGEAEEPLYPQIIAHVSDTGGSSFDIDTGHLRSHSAHWYAALVAHPEQLVPIVDLCVNEIHEERRPEAAEAVRERRREALHARVYNLARENRHAMRSIDPVLITEMVAVRGMVIRASPVIPDIQKAMYRCTKCAVLVEAEIEYGRIAEPRDCASCRSRDSYQLLHSRSIFADRQIMRLQEAPDQVASGETPATFTLVVYDDMVDAAKPGDRVEVTGILRASPVRVNPKMRTVKSVFRTYIDCIHVSTLNNNNSASQQAQAGGARVPLALGSDAGAAAAGGDGGDGDGAAAIDGSVSRDVYTPAQRKAREAWFDELARHPALYQRLSDSLAPSIFGMSDEKKGVLLQLFGGASKSGVGESAGHDSRNGAARFRSAINVLLVGDPGTSKSQLLQSAHRLAPRGVYTSGRGSSAVGLTAYVTRDPDTNDFVLESGALVLSDRGVCCIDEFDKMSDFARSILHEAMEQQTVSIAKAGIIATLNARTAVLAAANPVNSRYDPEKSVVDNIDLPPTLLSRFDLIYLVLDSPNADADRRLAKHIVSLFYKNYKEARATDSASLAGSDGLIDRIDDGINGDAGGSGGSDDGDGNDSHLGDAAAPAYAVDGAVTDMLDAATLTEYIAYAKGKVDPRLSNDAADALVNGYIDMRSGGRGGSTITATPRQLESLIRLAEAHARMSLKAEVESEDVEEAMRLVREAIHSAAFDPATGKINMDLFAMGANRADAVNTAALVAAVEEALGNLAHGGAEVRTGDLLAMLRGGSDASISPSELREALRELETQEKIVITSRGQGVRLRLG
jgi:DNA replication licensing factor MCM4